MDPGALVRTPFQTETQAGNGNSRFGAEGLQVGRRAVGTPVVVPLLAVGLAHGRGVDVAVGCAPRDRRAVPAAGDQGALVDGGERR